MTVAVLNNAGRAIITKLLAGSGQPQPAFGSWGTGGTAAAAANSALSVEMYSTQNSGTQNQRVTATLSQVTVSQTNDTYQALFTLTSTTTQTITNCGVYDTIGTAADLVTAPSGGNLFCEASFTGISLVAADSIQTTFKVTFS